MNYPSVPLTQPKSKISVQDRANSRYHFFFNNFDATGQLLICSVQLFPHTNGQGQTLKGYETVSEGSNLKSMTKISPQNGLNPFSDAKS